MSWKMSCHAMMSCHRRCHVDVDVDMMLYGCHVSYLMSQNYVAPHSAAAVRLDPSNTNITLTTFKVTPMTSDSTSTSTRARLNTSMSATIWRWLQTLTRSPHMTRLINHIMHSAFIPSTRECMTIVIYLGLSLTLCWGWYHLFLPPFIHVITHSLPEEWHPSDHALLMATLDVTVHPSE